jgi:hypothetical protein
MTTSLPLPAGPAGPGALPPVREAVLGAAKDMGRPIFYSTAVIIAAYLPIYVLSGPAERLFSRWSGGRKGRLRGAASTHPKATR